jgi:hypothetical protein
MKFHLLIHTAITLCAAAVLVLIYGFSQAVSFLFGALVILVDVAVLAFVLPFIFAKKQFALSIGVIVFKFAILAWIMNEAVIAASSSVSKTQFSLGWFAMGIALINVSALVTAAKFSRS